MIPMDSYVTIPGYLYRSSILVSATTLISGLDYGPIHLGYKFSVS